MAGAQVEVSIQSHSTRSPSRARSISSYSSISSCSNLRLADIAKQYGMGVHVENWREDLQPIRQYLPMQHIIGSLKRDRDEPEKCLDISPVTASSTHRRHQESDTFLRSPRSDDSFLEMLRTPKRRRTSGVPLSDSGISGISVESDPDRRFSWQAADHIAKDIPQSALPGLNHILNLSTITADERDIFTEYAPKHLEDAQLLMGEVLRLREDMMKDEDPRPDGDDHDFCQEPLSPILPPERIAEVREALDEWVNFNPQERYIAKI